MNEQPKNLYTAYICDRCGRDNAIKYFFVINKDYKGDNVAQNIDLCSACMVVMASTLMNRLAMSERRDWLNSFLQGIIR